MELTPKYVQGLIEKTSKALESLEVLEGGKAVYDMALSYRDDAKHFAEKGELVTALAAVEYSHGLLDGAVGSGAMKVLENEELFVF
ncbi:TPA: DUF357 domain-containing protein [archaeon]|jgi:hypothetical protein|uniref:DUF357 domain-containing protein n=1 Tax=Candidatus Undinarchaeum marinum TaxID=2756141 RepID=A0A832V3X6_9ARCH|nr:DUF357 domain-containing protein [Candidatus Undinarchaeum marinum]